MMISITILRILFLSSFIGHSYGFVDYSENTELIQQRIGHDVKLQCGLKGLIDDSDIPNTKVHWFFKQCIESSLSYYSNCHDSSNVDWIPLPCGEALCKQDLVLHNITEKYSGLYKCTVYPYRTDGGHSLDIQLVRTFQLDVKNTSLDVPEFLDSYPMNKSVSMGAQVVFQCRVHSEEHPTVRWFRRMPEPKMPAGMEPTTSNELVVNARVVKYNGHTYELLDTAREKYISDNVYLSKLILNGVRYRDEGYYACAAISYKGHKIREAFLKVNGNDDAYGRWSAGAREDNKDQEDVSEGGDGGDRGGGGDGAGGHTDPHEFWMLFLMPLGLAMLPVSVWLGYVIYKKCKRSRDQRYWNGEMTEEHCVLRM